MNPDQVQGIVSNIIGPPITTNAGQETSADAAQRAADTPPTPPSFTFVNPYTSDQLGAFFYRQWAMDTTYETDEGVVGAPTYGGNTKAVQLHKPITYKTITWTAEREGAWPVLPHWDNGDDNAVLMSKKIIPANPLLNGDTYTYRVSGVYKYFLLVALGDSDPMPAGHSPADTATYEQTTLQPSQFDPTLNAVKPSAATGAQSAPSVPSWQNLIEANDDDDD